MFKKLKKEIEEVKYCPKCKKQTVWDVLPMTKEDVKQMVKDAWSFKFLGFGGYPKSMIKKIRCKECGFIKTIP